MHNRRRRLQFNGTIWDPSCHQNQAFESLRMYEQWGSRGAEHGCAARNGKSVFSKRHLRLHHGDCQQCTVNASCAFGVPKACLDGACVE